MVETLLYKMPKFKTGGKKKGSCERSNKESKKKKKGTCYSEQKSLLEKYDGILCFTVQEKQENDHLYFRNIHSWYTPSKIESVTRKNLV